MLNIPTPFHGLDIPMDFFSTKIKVERLEFDIERLSFNLKDALSSLPALESHHSSEAGDHSPLVKLIQTIDAIALRVKGLPSCNVKLDTCDRVGDLFRATLLSVAEGLEHAANSINKETNFDYETRAYMLKETKKRVLQTGEAVVRATIPVPSPPKGGKRFISMGGRKKEREENVVVEGKESVSSSVSSGASAPKSIGEMLQGVAPPVLKPENRGGEVEELSATPRLRDIIRLGSYQNAFLFTGSPVAARRHTLSKPPGR